MYANLFIPAQVERLPEGTLAEALRSYRTTLASIPPPVCDLDDSPAQMRAQLRDAIAFIEEQLAERRQRAAGVLLMQGRVIRA